MPGPGCSSTFRAVYGGVQHDRLKLPAYGGQPVRPRPLPVPRRPQAGDDAGRTPPATPLPVNNRTVLHLLEALQVLSRSCQAARPAALSFRALDIEQIGHVYEGLLDHTAKRATEPVLGLTGATGQGAGDRPGRAGAAPGQGRGRTAQVPQGRDGPVGERPQEGA